MCQNREIFLNLSLAAGSACIAEQAEGSRPAAIKQPNNSRRRTKQTLGKSPTGAELPEKTHPAAARTKGKKREAQKDKITRSAQGNSSTFSLQDEAQANGADLDGR